MDPAAIDNLAGVTIGQYTLRERIDVDGRGASTQHSGGQAVAADPRSMARS